MDARHCGSCGTRLTCRTGVCVVSERPTRLPWHCRVGHCTVPRTAYYNLAVLYIVHGYYENAVDSLTVRYLALGCVCPRVAGIVTLNSALAKQMLAPTRRP